MNVTLEAIQFRSGHDVSTAALPLRRNAANSVPLPEWQRGSNHQAADSPAAYALRPPFAGPLTIGARFSRSLGQAGPVEVRALDAIREPLEENADQSLGSKIRSLVGVGPTGVLGHVRRRAVRFNSTGDSGLVNFEVGRVRLHRAGIGVYDIKWRWQFRERGGPWTELGTTEHRIYVVLGWPQAPWQLEPGDESNTQLPWTEVLEYACRWAGGARDLNQIAMLITREVYNLGRTTIEFDAPGGGSSHYALAGAFHCTALLERLRGGFGRGPYVNSSDCAAIVSTFANILGCNLAQVQVGWAFGVNPLLRIGSTEWQPPCGWPRLAFHEVAWKGPVTAEGEVFDGCLQIDASEYPAVSEHLALLSTSLPFGLAGEGQYRDRVATVEDRAICEPQLGTSRRRPLI